MEGASVHYAPQRAARWLSVPHEPVCPFGAERERTTAQLRNTRQGRWSALLCFERRGKSRINVRSEIAKRILIIPFFFLAICWIPQSFFAVEPPLSEDDVLLLLIGSAPPGIKARVIRLHGIETKWSQDFRGRLSSLCMEEDVRSALEQEFQRSAPGARPELGSASSPLPGPASTIGRTLPFPAPSGLALVAPLFNIGQVCNDHQRPAPDERLLARIVSTFADNDAQLEALLRNYTYHQLLLAKEIEFDGSVQGTHFQEWEILYGDHGERVFREVACTPDTLKKVHVLAGTSKNMEHIQPLTFPPEVAANHIFQYIDHVALDQIHAYKFQVTPRNLQKGKFHFSGFIWVEDRSLQIVKAEGGESPAVERGMFTWTIFPHFVTFRSQLNGGLWFPTLTVGESTINGLRFHVLIKYFDYQRFQAESHLTPIIDEKKEGD